MRFELLGPLKVLEGESEVTPARPKQRALLSLLLLRRGEVVPGAQLIDALWGEEPPGTAQTALHGHVSTLRKLIGADRIETRPPGYSLQVAPDEVDVGRFESLVAAARSLDDPGERSTGLRAALALWHGEPLVELRGEPFAEREIARLEELRLAALEDRIDADLALGRHRELVAELEPLVAEHVFRERPRGQLMLALYRCGRQADALHVFQRGRGALVEELGIEPGPALQELQLRILRHDPSLELSAHPPAPGPPPVRDALKIAYAPWAGEPERSPLVGRDGELEQLGAALRRAESGSAATVLVAGEGGIGKTRLAKAVAARARAAGFRVLAGRCLDLVGPELPYLPFAEALRPLVTALPFAEAGSQWRGFEQTLALLDGLAAEAPLLLVLEDLHWADASTLDLVAYLAHSLGERRVLLLGTCRPDEPAAAESVRRLADGVQRAAGGRVLELGPLEPADVTALLGPRAGARAQAIVARAEGNPFFAEELLAAAGDDGLPRGLRDLLLARVARLDRPSKGVVRLAAAAGREVEYALLRAAAGLPDEDVQASLRAAVEHGVLVADQPTRRFRFRHALLAEAVYSTLLPGEREEAHARLAEALARADPPAAAGELAPHWAAARRPREALVASIAAAREAEAVFGLAEALGHLERALAQWDSVPDAPSLAGLDHAALASWAAEQAVLTGAAPRAVELGGQAIALVGDDPVRAGLLHARLGRYLNLAGRRDASLAAFQRAVALVPQAPPSAERAQVLAALGHILMLVWRHEASRATSEQALRLARAVGARAAENRALIVLGVDLAYLGHGDEGLTLLRQALRMAVEDGPPEELFRAYTCLTDVLTMLGRPRESARLAAEGAAAVRRYGIEHGTLVGNQVEALLASGEWDAADDVSAAALRANTANWPHHALTVRAAVETGRGDFDAARAHLEAALASVRDDDRGSRNYDPVVVELALWERRWSDAADAVRDALPRAEAPDAALFRVQLCAHGLRAEAELALAGDAAAVHRARELLAAARRAATDAAAVTPNAAGWRALAEAEYGRACDLSSGHAWSDAAAAWERLERLPLVAYCRWRQAEALSAAGADATAPLDEARAVAAAIGARPLLRELERLAAG
ncbi:MAG TPA: BTAD domain-containing putative transcriptional regulator [Solirubrobacteraceae bacterium]